MGLLRLAPYVGQDGAIYTSFHFLFSSEVVLLSSVKVAIGYFNSQRL
jgi:hypothetical protein